jgi:hypothetical protein
MSKKNIFSPKINQDLVAYNVFDHQNDFYEDRLSFPVYREKIKMGHFAKISPRELKNWLLAYFCMGNPKKLVPR